MQVHRMFHHGFVLEGYPNPLAIVKLKRTSIAKLQIIDGPDVALHVSREAQLDLAVRGASICIRCERAKIVISKHLWLIIHSRHFAMFCVALTAHFVAHTVHACGHIIGHCAVIAMTFAHRSHCEFGTGTKLRNCRFSTRRFAQSSTGIT